MIIASAANLASDIHCDVCVIGAGPAGITTALELARARHNVVLVESGSVMPHEQTQRIADAERFDAARHAPMQVATRRQLGGTSAVWGGRCVPLDPVDFIARAVAGHTQWPIAYAELARFWGKACEYLMCGRAEFNAESIGAASQSIVPGFVDGEIRACDLERWSLPADFGKVHREELQRSAHIRLILGMTCVGLTAERGAGEISWASFRSLGGTQIKVHARHFAVAGGGLESTRLLMNCDSQVPGGLGNHSGWLGVGYMGHLQGQIAEVRFNTPAASTLYGFQRDAQGVYCRRRFTVSTDTQLREGLLNSAIWLNNPSLADASHRNGILSMSHLALSLPGMRLALAPEAIRRAAIDSERRSPALNHWRNILRDLPRTAAFVPHYLHKRYLRPRKLPAFFLFNPGNRYCLYYQGEQAPDPNSRVTLGEQRDALGMRRLVIEFRYSAADIESVLRTHQLLGAHLGRLGLGELHYLAADPRAAIDRQATDGIHQIGTTRMSQRPEDGVVDAHCRVHSTTNLFVASSSVFPTSGQANPTLPIVAMAVRVAETINAELNGRRLYQQAVSRIIAPAANRPAQPQPAISAPS